MTRTPAPSTPLDALEARFGRRVAARLNDGSQQLPHDIGERLRAARMQALAQRKTQERLHLAPVVTGHSGGSATLGWGKGSWWTRLGLVLPLVALVAGLFTISTWQDERAAREMADVDTALLTDALPPAAYTDPGFAQFLKRESDPH